MSQKINGATAVAYKVAPKLLHMINKVAKYNDGPERGKFIKGVRARQNATEAISEVATKNAASNPCPMKAMGRYPSSRTLCKNSAKLYPYTQLCSCGLKRISKNRSTE